MKTTGKMPDFDNLSDLGLNNIATAHWNLSIEKLSKITIANKMGEISSSGAISVKTGKFTGRSPKDRFIVKDDITNDVVWWGDVNIPFDKDKFEALYEKVVNYLENKEVYVRDVYACSLESFQLNIRSINEYSWSNHVCELTCLMRPSEDRRSKNAYDPEWHCDKCSWISGRPCC